MVETINAKVRRISGRTPLVLPFVKMLNDNAPNEVFFHFSYALSEDTNVHLKPENILAIILSSICVLYSALRWDSPRLRAHERQTKAGCETIDLALCLLYLGTRRSRTKSLGRTTTQKARRHLRRKMETAKRKEEERMMTKRRKPHTGWADKGRKVDHN